MYLARKFVCILAVLSRRVPFCDLLWKAKSKESDPSLTPLFVTQHLESGAEIENIQQLARVSLFNETHESYSGYITVNGTQNSHLFFWFFKSVQESTERPVVLWLQGGPGDSFMTTLFGGNGPYRLTNEGYQLADSAWTDSYNMLYIDNPVGTGYSFTSQYKYYSKTLNEAAENLYSALQQFFCIFPEFAKNEFYLAGESYAGKYIPALTAIIHTRNNENNTCTKINLKGLFIGCGFIDPVNQFYYADNLYEFGIVNENKRDKIKSLETAVRDNIKKGNYYLADAILVSLAATILGIGYWPPIDILNPQIDATEYKRIMEFAGQKEVRKELHVGKQEFLSKKMVVWNFKKDFLKSASEHLLESLKHYRVLLYSGQFDMLIPPMQIDKVVDALNWTGLNDFQKSDRNSWYIGDELAGYKRASGNLIVVEVRKANHFILRSQPKWIFELFTSFVNNTV